MSSSRFGKAVPAAVFAVSLLLSSPAVNAAQRVDDPPRDPIGRIVRIIRKIFTISPNDDYPQPPHPDPTHP